MQIFFFSAMALTAEGSYFKKGRNCFCALLMGQSTTVQSPFHAHLITPYKLSQTPSLLKDLVGICRFYQKEQKTWEEGGEKLHFDVKWEGVEVENLCSCLYYFSKFIFICTEKQFQKKVLTCPDNKLFACKQT